jgi:uncharacterized protein YndB with AHSA1/START domain
MSGPTLVLTRVIAVPVADVWPLLVEPAELRQWLGPRDFTVTALEADARVGGVFRFRMRKQGGGEYGAEGRYLEITENVRVVMTWRWNEAPEGEPLDTRETRLTIELEAVGEQTRLTLTHASLPDDESVKSHGSGWSEALDKLEKYFESRNRGEGR